MRSMQRSRTPCSSTRTSSNTYANPRHSSRPTSAVMRGVDLAVSMDVNMSSSERSSPMHSTKSGEDVPVPLGLLLHSMLSTRSTARPLLTPWGLISTAEEPPTISTGLLDSTPSRWSSSSLAYTRATGHQGNARSGQILGIGTERDNEKGHDAPTEYCHI